MPELASCARAGGGGGGAPAVAAALPPAPDGRLVVFRTATVCVQYPERTSVRVCVYYCSTWFAVRGSRLLQYLVPSCSRGEGVRGSSPFDKFELACTTPHGAEMVKSAELAEHQAEEQAHVDVPEHGADCGGKVRPYRAQVLV